MGSIDKKEKDILGDFVDDEEYYQVRAYKPQVEKVTWSITIYTAFILLFYILFLLINTAAFNWQSFIATLVFITLYFCMAAYSNTRPFTAFIAVIILTCISFILQLMAGTQLNMPSTIIKAALLVYICINLEKAKIIEAYEKSTLNKS